MTSEKEFDIIKEEAEKAYATIIQSRLLQKYNVKTFSYFHDKYSNSKGNGNFIEIDNYFITDIRIDQYNNAYYEMDKQFPIHYLEMFSEIIYHVFENDSYKGRSVIALYITYFELFHNNLSLKDIEIMYRHPKFRDDGFKEWLVGKSYSSSGNIPYDCKFSRKELESVFTNEELKIIAKEKYDL
jgi:hypothetical protein